MGIISRASRKATATIVEHTSGSKGGETKYRFPMPDLAHARNALARLPQAKGLSSAQKSQISARAHRMLGKPSKKNYSPEAIRAARGG